MIEFRWLAMAIIAAVLAVTAATPVVVAPPPRLFGISAISDPASILAAARSTSGVVGRQIDIINIYKAWVWKGDLPVAELTAIRNSGAVPEITWEPWDPNAGTAQSRFTLQQIVDGGYDAYIGTWAKQAAAWSTPLYLRFAHEMNGTWYPWALGNDGNSPALYVEAYAHVHRIFAAAGARNVRWVWSPHVMPQLDVAALAASYPGPGLVDVVGVDGYISASNTTASGWESPTQVFGPLLAAIAGIAPQTPVWINETGCSVRSTLRAGCNSSIIDYFRSTTVSALMWFDLDDGRGTDWRLAPDSGTGVAARNSLRNW